MEEWEIDRITDIINALGPLKVILERLCRRDATLLTADAAINFVVKKLGQLRSGIAQELEESFRRIYQADRTVRNFSVPAHWLHNNG